MMGWRQNFQNLVSLLLKKISYLYYLIFCFIYSLENKAGKEE